MLLSLKFHSRKYFQLFSFSLSEVAFVYIKAVLSGAEHDTPKMPQKVSLIPNAEQSIRKISIYLF